MENQYDQFGAAPSAMKFYEEHGQDQRIDGSQAFNQAVGVTITDVRGVNGDSAFLVDDGKTAILYDTGFAFTGYQVAANVKKTLGDRPLDFIFLTHSHYDHVLGVPYVLKTYPQAKVVAGSYAAGIFQREGARKVMKELDQSFAKYNGIGDYEYLGDDLRVDLVVNDGDTVQAGEMTFQAVNLPGHTRCSVGYYCKEKKLLLSTETIGLYIGYNMILPNFLVGYQMALDSIDRAYKLDIDYLLAPHYGLLTKEETHFFLENMCKAAVDYVDHIAEMLRNGYSIEQIIEWFKARYWNGYLKSIYPEAAMNLNSTIMINLIRKEVLGQE